MVLAWGLEARFPFLGHSFAELAVNLKKRYKLRASFRFHDWRHPFIVDKWAIRKLAERYIPKELYLRKKIGFPVSTYLRMNIDMELFRDGFVSDWFGLNMGAHSRPDRLDPFIFSLLHRFCNLFFKDCL